MQAQYIMLWTQRLLHLSLVKATSCVLADDRQGASAASEGGVCRISDFFVSQMLKTPSWPGNNCT